MLQNPAWTNTDKLARGQLAMFHTLANEIGLTTNNRQRVLKLDDRMWAAWTRFLADGPLPAEPPLPEMLRRISAATFRLSLVAQ